MGIKQSLNAFILVLILLLIAFVLLLSDLMLLYDVLKRNLLLVFQGLVIRLTKLSGLNKKVKEITRILSCQM